MQSRKPPVPRKPVLPPKPSVQLSQAPGGQRPRALTGSPHCNTNTRPVHPHLTLRRNEVLRPPAEDKPSVSPLPLRPCLNGSAPTDELPTPTVSPKGTLLTVQRQVTQGEEEKPELKGFKTSSRLTPQHGCRSAPDGSETTDSNGVASEHLLPAPCSPVGHERKHKHERKHEHEHSPCHCHCHQHRPGMKLVWVPVESGTGQVALAETTTEDSMEALREREDGNKKNSATGEVKVVCFLPEVPDLEYECMVTEEKPLLPVRPAQPPAASPTVKHCQRAAVPQPASLLPSPDTSPRPDTRRCKANSPTPPHRIGQGNKESPSPGSKASPSPENRPLPPIPVPQSYKERPRPVLSYMLSPRGCPPPNRKQPVKNKDDPYESHYYSVCDPAPGNADVNLGNEYEWVSVQQKDMPVYIEVQPDPDPNQQPLQEKDVKEVPSDAFFKEKPRRPLVATKSEKLLNKQMNRQGNIQVNRANSLALDSTMQCNKRRAELRPALWQERPEVKRSGVLDSLSQRELLLQESMFEVLTSEESYLSSLKVLTDHFLGSRDLNDTLVIHDKKRLFSNIVQVYEVSERFLADLKERVDQNVIISDVCDIIHNHAQHYFSVFTDYVRDQVYQEKTYTSLMQTNRPFAVVMRRLEESPLCKRLPFTSFLLLPFQRITRLKILLQNILKKTEEGSPEEQTSSQALAVVSEIIKDTNTQVGKMKQMEELISIANKLEFQKLKAVPIVSKTRYLEKQGELLELSKAGSLFNIRLRFLPVYVFLFNDLFVLANKKSQDRFVVIDHAHRSLVQAKAVGEDELRARFEHCFCLTFLENHQGQHCERLLKANTESDMHRWVAALPSLTDPLQNESEKVYTDWDCPQVQCVDSYTANQADELSLEPTDIINVLRKTHEGWYEGIRLSDGQKGWFPGVNVLEITNEHQRRRNLLEQFRILKLAGNVAEFSNSKIL